MSAILSPCGNFRYRLERVIGSTGPVGAFITVNPSIADAHVNDPTIRRVINFAKGFGWSRVIVGNLFAFRSSDIRKLADTANPTGPDNLEHLKAILQDADVVVVAWGTVNKLPLSLRSEWHQIVKLAEDTGKTLNCLGTANDGHPRHPLMLKKDAEPIAWSHP